MSATVSRLVVALLAIALGFADIGGSSARAVPPSDLTTAIAYDELDRPTSVTHSRSGSTVLALGYSYDPNGNLATLTDDTGSASFTYDDLDRLTAASYPGDQNYAYGYDAVGNLTSVQTPAGATSHTYDLGDRLTDTGYVFDDNGNLTADPSRTYTYDALGRLTATTSGGVTATYTLDGAGNRLAETVSGTTTSFDLDLSLSNPTVLADGSKTYLPGAPSAGYAEAGTWWTGLVDLVGSPITNVSQTGATTTPIHRDPFGAARPGSTSTAGIGFAGEWADPTGLLNLRARAYDPSAGRFAARDTFAGVASAPQTGNRYSYALNNPYRYTDPSGRFVQAVIDNPGLVASVALQAIPIIGDAYSGLTGIFGYDPLAGITLTDIERSLAFAAMLPFVPGVAGIVRSAARAGGAALDALRNVARPVVDAFSGVARLPGRVASRAMHVPGALASRVRSWAVRHTDDIAGTRRLPQDAAVNPNAPRALPLNRRVGNSPTQNALVQQRISTVRARGAIDFRVNQQQVNINGVRVGINRPDLQYTLDGVRVYEEFDVLSSFRGLEHQARALTNDPFGIVELFRAN